MKNRAMKEGQGVKQYAYIRVSTKEQRIDRQLEALKPYQVPQKNIYCDYQSGKNFIRPEYQKLLRRLQCKDLLIIKSIDRLGRNYSEILQQWQLITREIGADILVIDMPLLDTSEKNGNLTGLFIADMVLQILAYVAQTERDFIHQRQAEGIAVAREKGIRFGRPPVEIPDDFGTMYEKWKLGEMSLRQAAKVLGISHSTFYRRCKQRKT